MRTFIPIKTVSEANRRDHWAKKAKRVKSQREAVYLACPKAEVPCVVTLTRVAPRSLDSDNLQSALKATRDSVAQRLGVDDADERVEWRYAQEKGKEFGVVVEIESAKETTER